MKNLQSDDPNQPNAGFVGPLEVGSWPETLCARVVTPGAQPCVHGYDVESDLARSCRFSELILLTLTGELPSDEHSAAFDVAMAYLLPLSVAHAPTHATVLARLCGAPTSTMLGVAAVSLGEQARFILDHHEELLHALKLEQASYPDAVCSDDPEEAASVERLDKVLRSFGVRIPALRAGLTRMAALLAVLHYCGLTEREQLESVMVLARMPSALAEAFSERVANFRQYPINLPRYRYEESP